MQANIIGQATHRIFSIQSDEFCLRQIDFTSKESMVDKAIALRADIILTDALMKWLAQGEPSLILSETGDVLVGCAPQDQAGLLKTLIEGEASLETATGFKTYVSGRDSFFARKLRRREPLEVYDLRQVPVIEIEKKLFDLSYKGITDIVTKYVFPLPTWYVVRILSRFKIKPNAVTFVGIALCILASVYFYQGRFGLAFAAGWLMTFLDTVDGKLARVTATSSKIGNILDHGMDQIHPVIWWACLGVGIAKTDMAASTDSIVLAGGIIIGFYLLGRLSETTFKKKFGFNAYMWEPFDGFWRLIVARRNPNLLILTLGWAFGCLTQSFYVVAAWSVLSITVQIFRFVTALRRAKAGEVIDICLAKA